MPFFVPLLFIGGAVAGGVATHEAGQQAKRDAKAQQELANRNALLKERQAKAERERAQEEARQFEKEGEALQGTQQVTLAKGGVLTEIGTPALVLEETAQELEADRLKILKEGFLAESFRKSEAENLRFQGRIAKAKGSAAARGATYKAAGSLLTGFGQAGYMKSQA